MFAADVVIPILIPIPLIVALVVWLVGAITKPGRDREQRRQETALKEQPPRSDGDW